MKLNEIANTERPLLVSMLAKVLANHFKGDGPSLRLKDDEWDIDDPIYGYMWEKNALTLNVRRENGQQDITYTGDMIEMGDLTLRLDKSDPFDHTWVLRYKTKPRKQS